MSLIDVVGINIYKCTLELSAKGEKKNFITILYKQFADDQLVIRHVQMFYDIYKRLLKPRQAVP